MIDLHTHSTCSDGTLTPPELLAAARACGLSALSITDHDTLAAYDGPDLAGLGLGVEVLVGVELSLTWPRGNCHLLAYGLDPRHEGLRRALADLRVWRAERNVEMIERLAGAGLPIDFESVEVLAGGEPIGRPEEDRPQVGRPHMALALLRAGAVESITQAFERWLSDDSPCYVPRRDLDHELAFDLVRQAGGAAVLAHPYQTGLDGETLERAVAGWVGLGLDGLEVWYSRHTAAQVAQYEALARRFGLVMTVGSDFHGATKPDIALGQVAAGAPGDEAVLAALRESMACPS
jgi:hypothetical protein